MAFGGTGAMFEKESSNFFRCTYILLDIGAEVLREVFRTYYNPGSLQSYLVARKPLLDRLLHQNVLSPEQHSMLFPAATAPNDKQFDITLLSCLIRNLNTIYSVGNKVWINPSPTDLSVEADVTRVRIARNHLHGHTGSSTMSDQMFASEKNKLEQIYTRIINNLGRTSTSPLTLTSKIIQDKIEDTIHSPLERERHGALLTLLDTWHRMDLPQELTLVRDELSTLGQDQSVRFKIVEQDIRSVKDELKELIEEQKRSKSNVDRRKLERRLDDTLMAIEDHNRKNAKTWIKTRTYEVAVKCLETDKLIIVTGISGSGKTFLSWSLMYDCITRDKAYKPLELKSIKEWEKLVNPFENHIIIIDDFLGKYGVDCNEVNRWRTNANLINANINKGNLSVVLTVREHLLSDLKQTHCTDLALYEDPFVELIDRFKVIDLSSDKYKLKTDEKQTMLSRYLNEANIVIDKSKSTAICDGQEVIGFPQSCYMLKAMKEGNNPEELFTKPSMYLLMEIEKMSREDQHRYIVLVLLVVFGGNLSLKLLEAEKEKTEKILNLFNLQFFDHDILSTASTMLETYLTKIGDNYGFQHDSIHETSFISFVRKKPIFTIQTCPVEIVCKLCQASDAKTTNKGSGNWGTFVVQDCQIHAVEETFRKGLLSKSAKIIQNISAAKIWESRSFRSQFFSHLESENILAKYLTIADENGDTFLVHCSAAEQMYLLPEIIKLLQSEHIDNQNVQSQVHRALIAACKVKNTTIIDMLFGLANVVTSAVIFAAVKSGSVNILTKLASKSQRNLGEEFDKDGKSLLHIACLNGEDNMVNHLLELVPDTIRCLDTAKMSLLHDAVISGSLQIVKTLLDKGVDPKLLTQNKQNILHFACEERHGHLIQYLVDLCPELIDGRDERDMTPLFLAVISGDTSIVKVIIDNGSAITARDVFFMESALHVACIEGNVEMTKFLVDQYPQLITIKDKYGKAPVHYAAEVGNVEIFKCLVQKGADSMAQTDDGSTVLHMPIKYGVHEMVNFHGRLEMVKFLVDQYPKLTIIKNKSEEAPVHYAAGSGNVEIFKLLVEKGADSMVQTDDGSTVLHIASEYGTFEMVKFLVDQYPQLTTIKNEYEEAPVHRAANSGNVEIFKCLIEKGADSMVQKNDGSTVLHTALGYDDWEIVKSHDRLEMLKFLVDHYPKLTTIKNIVGEAPVHYAARNGNVEFFKCLVEKGADSMVQTDDGSTVLHMALPYGAFEMVMFLVDQFPKLTTIKNKYGEAPVHYAARSGNIESFKCLVEKGAESMVQTDDGSTVLHIALKYDELEMETFHDRLEMVKFLVDHYPKLTTIKNKSGEAPVHYAAGSGNVEIFKFLVEKGADSMVQTDGGSTVLHDACEKGQLEMVKFLVDQYPHLTTIKNKSGNAPVHYAARSGNVEIFKCLIEKGADSIVQTDGGSTVLHYACENGQLEMVKFLVEQYPQLTTCRDKSEKLPLHSAAQGGNIQVLEHLLDRGVDLMNTGFQGSTVLMYACLVEQLEMAMYLVSNFPYLVDIFAITGETPLHIAAEVGSLELVQVLVNCGINVYMKNMLDKTALDIASDKKYDEIVGYLLSIFPDLMEDTIEVAQVNPSSRELSKNQPSQDATGSSSE